LHGIEVVSSPQEVFLEQITKKIFEYLSNQKVEIAESGHISVIGFVEKKIKPPEDFMELFDPTKELFKTEQSKKIICHSFLKNLVRRMYDRWADFVLILGETGSGKTTFINTSTNKFREGSI